MAEFAEDATFENEFNMERTMTPEDRPMAIDAKYTFDDQEMAPLPFALPHMPMATTYNSGPFLVKVDGGLVITTTTVQFIPDGMHVPTEPADPGLDSAGTETLSESDFDVYEGE